MPLSIAYTELDNSPTIRAGSDGTITAVRTLKVSWANILQALIQLRGYAYQSGGNTIFVGSDQFYLIPACKCRDVDIKPFHNRITGTTSGNNTYDEALITATYSTVASEDGAGTGTGEEGEEVEEYLEPNTQVIPLEPDSSLFWDSGGTTTPLSESSYRPRFHTLQDYVHIKKRQASIPVAAITDVSSSGLVNSVNASSVTAANIGLTFAAETLFYRGVGIKFKTFIDENGDPITLMDCTYRFTYDSQGWNKVWRQGYAAKQDIYAAGSSTAFKAYPTSSYGQVL